LDDSGADEGKGGTMLAAVAPSPFDETLCRQRLVETMGKLVDLLRLYPFPGMEAIISRLTDCYLHKGKIGDGNNAAAAAAVDLGEVNSILCRLLIKLSADSDLYSAASSSSAAAAAANTSAFQLPTDKVDEILSELAEPSVDEYLYNLIAEADLLQPTFSTLPSYNNSYTQVCLCECCKIKFTLSYV
jgi:hypothetical protein